MRFIQKLVNALFGPPERRAAQSYEMGMKRLSKSDMFGAEYHFRSAARLQPQSAKYIVGYANLLLARGSFELANEHYACAAVLEAPNPILLSNWGVVLRILGRMEEAVEKHRQAVGLAPENATTLVNAGITLSEAGEIEEAIDFLERARMIDPSVQETWHVLEDLRRKAEKPA